MSTNVSNKVAASAVAVAMILSFAIAPAAKAQSVEELTAQIASLLATISSLQAQLAGMTGGSTTTGGSYNFTMNHKMGDNGGEVMDIQKFLNAQGFAVAATGAGSPGNESSYFGAKTKAAVIAWQNAHAAQVLTPVGLSAGTGYWGASSRAYANTMGGTTGGTTTPTPTGTGVTVAAAAQPSNGLAVTSAANVPFTKFTVTNNSGVAQTINSVTVERGGLANDAAFSSVALLDESGLQLGNTRTLNSVHQAAVGEAVVVNPGQTRTFTVVANMGSSLSSYAGQVATFSVVAVNTSATVAGSLPITGAAHTINASLSIGSVTAARGSEDPNATATKEIGTTGYAFTGVKFTAGSAEDVRLRSVRFDMSGSASDSDVANVMAYVDGTAYTPTIAGDVYTFNFGSGLVIKKGLYKEVTLKGDIIGGTNRTVAFDVYKLTDVNVTGETYGYGITPTVGTGWSSSSPVYDASVVTISAGSFNSVSKSNAAPAANIAVQTADQILGAFTVDLKGEAITVQTLGMTATIGGGPTGVDLDNVTLVDQNGAVLAGPVDASGDATGDLSFSNVSFPTGVTTVYVKGYLDDTFGAADTIVMSTTPSTDWSDATGNTTGDAITLPSSTATANTMTVAAAALSATTLTQPAARSVVPGAVDFVWATASLDAANSGEDVKVTALVVEDDTANGNGTEFDNVEIWANLSGGSAADSVRGDRFETKVSNTEQMTGTGDAANTLSFTLTTAIVVAKNTSVEIAVVGDLSSAASANDTHTVSLDTDAGDVTAVGNVSGASVSVTPSGAGQTMTASAGGDLVLTIDSSTPAAGLFLDSTSVEQTSAIFRLTANNVEDVDIDSIKLTSTGADDAVAKYVFYSGSTKLGEVTGGGNTAELFLADGTLVVPAGGYKLVTVKVVMNDIDGTQVQNGDTVITTIASSGDVDGTGMSSGSAIDPDDTSVAGNTMTVYEAYPVFAFEDVASTVLTTSANYLVAKIKVSNPGDEDLSFDDASTANNLEIQFAGNDATAALDEAITIKDENGNTLDSGSISSGAVAFDFSTTALTVPAGGYKYIYVYANASGLGTDGDTIQAWLDDGTAADLGFSIGTGTANYAEADTVFKGDLYGQTHVNP